MNNSWEYQRIGDVCTVERGGSPRPIDKYITDSDDGINWIKIGDTTDSMYITQTAQKIIPEGMKKSRYVKPGDFLLSNSMSFGRPYILAIDGCIHDGWLVLRDDNEAFDKRFLYYYLSSKTTYEKFKSLAVGGVVNNLNSEMVRNVDVPVPDKDEQGKIADLMDSISSVIDDRKKELDLLDKLIKARFVELFGEYFKNHINEKELDEICDFIDYRGKTPEKSEHGIPLITAKNVKDNKFFVNPQEFIPYENYDAVMTRGIPRVNDVLFTTEAPLGNVCRIPDVYEKFCVGQRLITMQPHPHVLNSEYLEHALASADFQDKVWQKSSGSTVKGIRSKLLVLLTIPVPPIEIQNEFRDFLHQVEKSKAAVQNAFEEMQLLFDSLMQEYFG